MAVIAKSYARIHKANLVNVGILPLVGDTAGIDQGDALEIDISDLTRPLVVRNLTKGTEIPVRAELSERERRMVKGGGLLAMALAGRR